MTGPQPPAAHQSAPTGLHSYRSLVLIIVLGAALRLVHVITLDFPLNDGGFFYQMIIDLQESAYRLPFYTTYNLHSIPYAYPPLAFYLTAGLAAIFKVSPLSLIRLLPALVSILTLPAFYLLARTLLTPPRQILFATLGFAFLPTAFDWLVVGGGLTRSFGYLFALLALWQIGLLARAPHRRHILGSIIFASLAVLSHPGTAWFTLYAALMILVFNFQRTWRWLLHFVWVAIGVTALTAPWWLTVIHRHGLPVLLYPFQTESLPLASLLTPFTFLFTNEPLLDLLAFCGLLGILVLLLRRQYFLPSWLFATFLFESRLGPTYAVVPMALLIGWGLDQVLWPLLDTSGRKGAPRLWSRIFAVFFLVYCCLNAYLGVNYPTLSPQERATMAWIAANTPPESRFLVISGQPHYGIDPLSEWFPTLTGRSSLTTPQAHEWLPNQEFSRRIDLHAALQDSYLDCPLPDLSCTLDWAAHNHLQFTHIYLPASALERAGKAMTTSQAPPQALNPNQAFAPPLLLLYDSPGGIVLTLTP